MVRKTDEQLSTLVDGECKRPEASMALRRLAKDADLKARWQRYHLIGDAMKNNLPEAVSANFSRGVSELIAAEPPPRTVVPAPVFSVSPWYKPLTGFALAASVALIAVLSFNLLSNSDNVGGGAMVKETVTSPEAEPATPLVAAAQSEVAGSNFESRLNDYLVSHNEYASMNSIHGVLSYVRTTGYATDR